MTRLTTTDIRIQKSSAPSLQNKKRLRLRSAERGRASLRHYKTMGVCAWIFTQTCAWTAVAFIILIASSQPLWAQTAGVVDPLSVEEIQYTLNSALQAGIANGADSELSAAAMDQEVLLVERHQGKKAEIQSASAARQGDVYVYDYGTDTLKHAIIDLDTGQSNVIEEMQNVQLPLTQREVDRALKLIFEDVRLRNELSTMYEQISGRELISIEQLNVKAFIFLAESMPDSVNKLSQSCGLHRCAQVLIYTDDDTVLEVQPVVDLSRRIITQDMTNNTTLITNEYVEETLANLSNQPENTDETIAADQAPVGTSFLPFMGRTGLTDGQNSSLTFGQRILGWWCQIFGGTFVDALLGNSCF